MVRRVNRTYTFSEQEIHEALLAALRARDIPAPSYVGNTPTCTWDRKLDGSIVVLWTDEDEVSLGRT